MTQHTTSLPSLEDAVRCLARWKCGALPGWPAPKVKNIREHRYKWTAEVIYCSAAASPLTSALVTFHVCKEEVRYAQNRLLHIARQRLVEWKSGDMKPFQEPGDGREGTP